MLACLILSACRPASIPVLDLEAGPEASFACGDRARCWSAPDGAAWERVGDVLRSPPLRIKKGDTLVLRVRGADAAVALDEPAGATPLARLEPARPWSAQLFGVPLPASSEPVRLELRPAGRSTRPELFFAEVLSAGRGRCYREHRWAERRLVDGVACLGPAQAELSPSAGTAAVDVVTLGSTRGPWRLSIEGAETPVQLERPKSTGWQEQRIPLPSTSAPRTLRFRVEGPPGALLVWSPREVAPAATPSRPNVLVFLVDTLRADALGAYGANNTTPHFDALARQGVLFERAFAPSSWTLPSVVSLLTGRDPGRHGVVDHRDALSPEIPTLAEQLGQDGRATAAVTASLWVTDRHGIHRGFQDLWDVSPERGPRGMRNGTSSADANERVLPWLEHHADERFFLYVHVLDPHQPYTPPDALVPATVRARWDPSDPRWRMARSPSDGRGRTGRSAVAALGPGERDAVLRVARELYDAAVRHADSQFGRILSALERLDLRERTLVVLAADHGEEFGEHTRTGHAHSLYTEVTHVPLILSLPGRIEPGVRVPRTVGLVQVAATVLELAGAAPAAVLSGASLGSWWDPGASGGADREAVRLMQRPQDRSRPIPGIPEMDGIVAGRWELIHNRGATDRPEWELFDLRADPGEQRERGDDEPNVRDRLADRLSGESEHELGHPAPRPAGPLDGETRERLRALGYAVD